MANKPNQVKPQVVKNEAPKANVPAAYVAAGALSTDVGQKAVEAWTTTYNASGEIKDLEVRRDASKREALAYLTHAFVHAAKNEPTIILANVNSDKKGERDRLREKLFVAIGIKTARIGEDGAAILEYSDWAKSRFPQPGEDEKSPDWRAKENFRSNFATAVTKCIGSANAIVTRGMNVRIDTDKQLVISGPAVKQHFDMDEVKLDEKKTVRLPTADPNKYREVELKAKPSFTELQRISHKDAGKTLQTRADSRPRAGVSEGELLQSVKAMMGIVNGLKAFGDELAEGLEELATAIDNAIQRREKVA